MTVEVPLSGGIQAALIDEDDRDRVLAMKWSPHKASTRHENWYAVTYAGRACVYLHRFIMGAPGGMQVDHIDRNGLNNRKANLRLCTRSQNGANGIKIPGKSGWRGVIWDPERQKYIAKITAGGRVIYGGYFCDPETAAMARDELALRHFGPFAVLNFPDRRTDMMR